jgi:tetratricopeptide (TPR) repeat protein
MTEHLLVYKITNSAIRGRRLSDGEILSFKAGRSSSWNMAELDTAELEIEREWQYNKTRYASGTVKSFMFIPENIEAKVLDFESDGVWDPLQEYSDEEEVREYFGDYIDEGCREAFTFKDYSGYSFYKDSDDPIGNSVDFKEMGDSKKAYDILSRLLEDMPECIDALVHIASMYFYVKFDLDRVHKCYERAVYIAERGFPEVFDPVFHWGCLENRPYLRAVHGLCLTTWRKGDFDGALVIAKRLLRMNPHDNLGARFLIESLENGEEWSEDM